ncbi:MAG TPA: mechanosensitive ion channel family protein [Bryobacteraceae bacterium]|nr:mechanosensitive ion channel family protein [Bryobacteraceae bacterium]
MVRVVAFLTVAGMACAQVPTPVPKPASSSQTGKDPLGRDTPQSSIVRFLEACHARDYTRAAYYLDRRGLSQADRQKGPELARQLEDLLDDTPFDIASLSREPEGDRTEDLPSNIDRLDTFNVHGKPLELQLERVPKKEGTQVWLVSGASVAMIPEAHQVIGETPFEKLLPQPLVAVELFDTPLWRWIALILMAAVLWVVATLVARVLVRVSRRFIGKAELISPLRLCLAVAAFRVAMELAPPATLSRLYIGRGLGLLFSLGLAWMGAELLEIGAGRWHSRLDPRVQAVSYSVLPLGTQVLKLLLFLIAILSVISAWGYNTSTILAGLGVGGLAVALAAQKTIENLFGGVSVIGDRPVLVGDDCRFGDRTGTVMHIGLRSTRIRTPDRTVISVPNAQFSAMSLENLSGRDKIWFHPMLNLRRDTTSEQLTKVLASIQEILKKTPKIEVGAIPVRFVGVGQYSLDVEVAAYVTTSNGDEFLAIQQQLLLEFLKAVEDAGTALALPVQESIAAK